MRWNGVIAVPNTPFAADGSVDFDSLARLCDYLAAARVPAALILGVAAEADLLSPEEQAALARDFSMLSSGRFDLILGVSGATPMALARATETAASLGVAAVNWRPPAGLPVAGFLASLQAIAGAAPVRIMLQDFDLSGEGLQDAALLAALSEVPAVAAVKVEVRTSLQKIARLKAAAGRDVAWCAGWPISDLLRSLAEGADAVMPTSLTPLLSHLAAMVADNRAEEAGRVFAQLAPLLSRMVQGLGSSIRLNKEMRRAEGVFSTAACRMTGATAFPVTEADLSLIGAAVRLQRAVTN